MNWGRYFALLIVLFLNLFTILVLGLRINFLGELFVFLLFLLFSLIMLVSVYNNKHSEPFISLFFLVSLINLWYIKTSFVSNPHVNVGLRGWFLFGLTLLLNAIGFLLFASLITKKQHEREEVIERVVEPFEEPEEIPPVEEYGEPKKTVSKKTSVKKTFKPGKFIASSNSTYYHAAKCDWAKKISKTNRVWFKSKEDARKKGFKQHSCLKK
ncbi:hypothetical protein CEE44_04445 [Candidatus Woesearchaeota archaeon B3_Woes]|nr:MAG: hypothetical protein CEE44_04445 [Candidatus Woesearchaeota archaeon B3_Woes]